jgi:protein-tyrosine kinase
MSEQPTFSLAVVRGGSAGKALRSARKRISVGSAPDNDLVLDDPGVAPRHFLVLIDGGRWRIHTLTDKDAVRVDKRWTHPDTGKRGALIQAAGSEIILFPGHLDQRTVDREVQLRAGVEDATEMATNVSIPAPILDSGAAPNEPTVAVSAIPPDPRDALDLVEMAQMPTIAGERPPEELREAAQAMLASRRNPESGRGAPAIPVAPSVLRESSQQAPAFDPLANAPVKGELPRGGADERTVGLKWQSGSTARPTPAPGGDASRWERARRPTQALPHDPAVPEVLAEPESQMMAVPGAVKSVMSQRPDFATGGRSQDVSPPSDELAPPPMTRRSAWAEARTPEPVESEPPRGPGGRNAWGDPSSRALVPTRSEEERRKGWGGGADRPKKANAWGDRPQQGRPADPAASYPPPPPPPGPGPTSRAVVPREGVANLLELSTLAGRGDAALEILSHPDAHYATQVRLLGAKIDEFRKNLGYRAYMVSSAEPLAGKTTAACNLAFALAEDTQRRVALVEANFRFPRFAEILGLDERTGLIAVLEGRARLNEVGYKLSDRNLVILPAGGRHPAPAEVLASPRFKALVAELVDTVDIALIDAPSVAPFADANMILPLVDAAFLVVTEQQTRRSWLGRAVGQLGEARVLGTLFNHIPKKVRKDLARERKERLKARS